MGRILNCVVREGLSQVVLFKSRHKEARRGKEFSGREKDMYEGKK